MSPRDFDAAVVQRRLVTMRQMLRDLESFGPVTESRLREDAMLRYGVERIITQLVDLAVAINSHIVSTATGRAPDDYRSSFRDAAAAGALSVDLAERIAPSVGLRNVLVHTYTDTDFEIVAESAAVNADEFGEYCAQVARWLAVQ